MGYKYVLIKFLRFLQLILGIFSDVKKHFLIANVWLSLSE